MLISSFNVSDSDTAVEVKTGDGPGAGMGGALASLMKSYAVESDSDDSKGQGLFISTSFS
jgi:hypothetical protein